MGFLSRTLTFWVCVLNDIYSYNIAENGSFVSQKTFLIQNYAQASGHKPFNY